MAETKKYNFLKASTWYILSNILIKGVSFFVLPVFTDLMTTEEYGVYGVYTSYLTIFEAIVLFGLSSTVRIAKFDNEIDYDRFVSTIFLVPSGITAVFLIIINIFVGIVGEFLSMNLLMWNFLLITSLTSAVSSIICSKMTIDGSYKLYVLYALIYTAINIGLSLVLCYTVYKNHDVYMARIVGACAAGIISLILLVCFAKVIHKFDFRYIKLALKWGFPLLLHTVATVILTQSDRIIVDAMTGKSAAGIYSITITFIAIPLTIYTSLENAWAPWFCKNYSVGKYEDVRKFNNVYMLAFFLIISLFMLISPELVHLFTDRSYWDSVYSLVPLSMSVFFELTYGICVNIEYLNKKNWLITISTLITIVINIGLDVLFIYLWGYTAAAYATVLSKMVLFFIHYLFSRKIDKNKTFSLLLLLILSVLLFGLDAFIIFFVNTWIARLGLGVVYLIAVIILLVKKGKQILSILKTNI